MSVTTLNASQKAAALVLALGPQQAARVFAHLPPEDVERLAREVAALGQLAREDVAGVLHEFLETLQQRRQTINGGNEAARQMLQAWGGGESAVVDRVLGADGPGPFAALRRYGAEQLNAVLADEHPQTAALVLANLPARQAGRVMATFDLETQRDIALRIATLEPVRPELAKRVEADLLDRLGDPAAEVAPTGAGGLRELASMLKNLDSATEAAILEGLAHRDPAIARRVRELQFVFADLTTLDDRAIQEVMRTVDPKVLATAMKGVAEHVSAVIWRNLSERASTALKEEQELLGPTKRADVERAQSEVVAGVRRLADEGVIVVSRGDEEDVVA